MVTALAVDRQHGIRPKPLTADKALERIGIRRAALALRERLVERAVRVHDVNRDVVDADLRVGQHHYADASLWAEPGERAIAAGSAVVPHELAALLGQDVPA